jgi:hypothetical protein
MMFGAVGRQAGAAELHPRLQACPLRLIASWPNNQAMPWRTYRAMSAGRTTDRFGENHVSDDGAAGGTIDRARSRDNGRGCSAMVGRGDLPARSESESRSSRTQRVLVGTCARERGCHGGGASGTQKARKQATMLGPVQRVRA